MAEELLKATGLYHVFESQAEEGNVVALRGLSVALRDGEAVAVVGPSGAGKSTLLRMINRLIDPSEGRIAFHGDEVSSLSGQALRNWQRDCAMIFQQFNLVPRLDVLTNVLLGRLNDGVRCITYGAQAGATVLTKST